MTMPTPTRISDRQIKQMSKRVALEAMQDELLDDESYENEVLDEENQEIQTEEEVEEEIRLNDIDIFSDVGDVRAKKGDVLRYTIELNNARVAEKFHPYSWKKVQDELTALYGEGSYKIRAHSSITGRIIKTQTKMVLMSEEARKSKSEDKNTSMFNDLLQTFQNNMKQDNERRDREIKEEKERMREESNKSNQMMQTLLTSVMNKAGDTSHVDKLMQEQQNNQNNMLTMFMAMMNQPKEDTTKPMMEMMFRMQEQQNAQRQQDKMEMREMMREMQSQTKELISSLTDNKSNDAMSPIQMLEFYQKTQQETLQQRKQLIEEIKDETPEKDSSVTTSLMKNFGPLLGAMLQSKNTPQVPPQLPQQVMQNPSQVRRNAPRRQAPRKSPFDATQPQMPRANAQKPVKTAKKPVNSGLPSARPIEVESKEVKPSKNAPIVEEKGKKGIIEGDNNIKAKREFTSELTDEQKSQVVDAITEMIAPVLVENMMAAESPKDAIKAVRPSLELLVSNKVNPMIVIELITAEKLIEITASKGLKEQDFKGIEEWLRTYHYEFEKAVKEASAKPTR